MKIPNISEGERKRTISGSISSLFHRLTVSDECRKDVYLQLLGTPIKDENDNVVGKITCLDIDNDIFYATLNRDVKGITYELIRIPLSL